MPAFRLKAIFDLELNNGSFKWGVTLRNVNVYRRTFLLEMLYYYFSHPSFNAAKLGSFYLSVFNFFASKDFKGNFMYLDLKRRKVARKFVENK